jgi:hypothetical protein
MENTSARVGVLGGPTLRGVHSGAPQHECALKSLVPAVHKSDAAHYYRHRMYNQAQSTMVESSLLDHRFIHNAVPDDKIMVKDLIFTVDT